MRQRLLEAALGNGLNIGGCGTHGVRLRPALVFGAKHCEQMLHILDKTLAVV